jgi:hypothetical protein
MMKKLSTLILFMIFAGCASTGVVLMEKDKYMVAKRSAQAGRGPVYGAQADVYREANEFCGKQGKDVETVNLIMNDAEFAKPGSVSLEFRCVAK